MGYILSHTDSILLRSKADTIEKRCWNPFAKCPFTEKRMFGKKCTKLNYHRLEYSVTYYADTERYAYELMTFNKSDIPYPPAFNLVGSGVRR